MTGTRSPSAVFIAAFLLAFAGGAAPLAGQAAIGLKNALLYSKVAEQKRVESEIEIRRVFEAEDFGESLTPELRQQEERLRAQSAEQQRKAATR